MTKSILILAIVAAFVAGSITTGSMAYAAAGGTGDNLIVDALNRIATAISGINPNVNVSPTPVNVNVDPTPITINAPQGVKGDKGDKGDKGEQGDSGTSLVVKILPDSPCVLSTTTTIVSGWCPDGVKNSFSIFDEDLTQNSIVLMSTSNVSFGRANPCVPHNEYSNVVASQYIFIVCNEPVEEGRQLMYSIID